VSDAVRVENATKVFGEGDTRVTALSDLSLSFERGKFTAIMGPSGSGKSTLLHCIAGLDLLTDGCVYIGEVCLSDLSEKQLTLLRREKVGFIFQSFNLIPTLDASENITLPVDIAGGIRCWRFDTVVARSSCAIASRIVPVSCPVASSSR
jgi:putative ABC transport system ATP-binding protein